LAGLFLLLLTPGCSWWHNFSTYFNTLYLAETHLDAYEAQQEAIVPANPNGAVAVLNHRWLEEEYQMRQLGLRDGHAQAITPSFSQSLTATKQVTNVHLDSAIILGSKILADKNASKYVEDALFVVGKAEFYKNDFATARRKFLELLAHYPDTKYGAAVSVFLARSMISGREFDTAGLALEKGLASATKAQDKLALSSVHRAYAEYLYARNPDSLSGIGAQLHEAESGVDGEDLARLAYEEGMVDFLAGEWSQAEQAFKTSYESAKDDWLAGEAHVQHALALRHQEKFTDASTELAMVLARVKYGGSHAAARYEIAYTNELAARKAVAGNLRSPEFRNQYHTELNTAYHIIDTSYSKTSAVMISRVRFRQAEMFREMGMYDSASRMAATLIGTKDFSSPAMNEFVSQHATSLASFAKWRAELAHADSTEARVKIKPAKYEGAEIHIQAVHEAVGARWRPEVPPELTKEDSVRILVIEARLKHERASGFSVSDTSTFLDSLHFHAAQAHYQLGRAYETFLEIPSARSEYRASLGYHFPPSDTAANALVAQSLYAWMQLERREKNLPASDSLLAELLSKHGQTIYAEQARILFSSSAKNSRAEFAYRDAYKILRESGLNAAKNPFLDVVATYDQEDVAPRSLLAIGVSYEEQERYDSAVVYYKRILKDYPYSTYAQSLHPRLAEAGMSLPHASPVVDPTAVSPDQAEQQRQQAEQARKMRDQEMQRRSHSRRPGIPPGNQPVPPQNPTPTPPGNTTPPSETPPGEPIPPGTPGVAPPGLPPPPSSPIEPPHK